MDIEKIGRFIAECRKEKGLTQEQLAEKLGVTNRSISRWETGKTVPDISLYEKICRELGITIAELFAGQHVTPQNQAVIANYSLEQILKEYSRMKKQRSVLGIILIVIAGIFVGRFILQMVLFYGIFAFEMLAPTKRKEGADAYDKTFYLEKYGGDLNSNLYIFPDEIEGKEIVTFKSGLKTGFFDTDGYILLECRMSEEAFQQEIARLAALEATIEFNGETYTNYVMYDEESYPYPAYITLDGFDSSYEYALLDEEAHRIIYLYISYPSMTNLNYAKYLKKNLLSYTQSGLDSYTLYHHTFDGGASYIGVQD